MLIEESRRYMRHIHKYPWRYRNIGHGGLSPVRGDEAHRIVGARVGVQTETGARALEEGVSVDCSAAVVHRAGDHRFSSIVHGSAHEVCPRIHRVHNFLRFHELNGRFF